MERACRDPRRARTERRGTLSSFRHRQTNDACPLSDVKQVWTDKGVTLACTDCDGLLEMPCPYCDYVRIPNKSGLGMSIHIFENHREHVQWVESRLVVPDA